MSSFHLLVFSIHDGVINFCAQLRETLERPELVSGDYNTLNKRAKSQKM